MTDDAPSNGTPDSPERPTAPQPDKTVMRPQGAAPGPLPDANQTVVRPGGPAPGSAVDNPDFPPPSGSPVAPGPPGTGPATPGTPGTPGPAGDHPATGHLPATSGGSGGSGGDVPPGRLGDGVHPEFPTRASRAGITGAVVALGTGLLGAAVLVSALRSRSNDEGELDWSTYGVGLAATAALLLIAVLGIVAARRDVGGRAREEVVTWPGTVGILAVAVMLDVGIESSDRWPAYLAGGVVVALSVLGYLAARRAAFVVTAILGLALLYGLAFDDFVADSIGDEHASVVVAAVVGVFVLVVTLLGWLLPTRAVSGVVVGAFAVAAYVGIMAVLLVTQLLSGLFGGVLSPGGGLPNESGGEDSGWNMMDAGAGYAEADVWWVLAFAAVLTLVWALAAAVSDHSGFSLLAIAMPALLVPMATFVLAVEQPTYWSAALAAAGGVLLLGGVLLARARGRRTAAETSYTG
ncbi:hypothetical protein [Nocardioides sp. SYSU DS0651]|uniref:hypothetical protein n=1 Tax=Nocardioides sp. SYSU DS0651 TaxID=3415955 RepID=UPI003F4B5AAB